MVSRSRSTRGGSRRRGRSNQSQPTPRGQSLSLLDVNTGKVLMHLAKTTYTTLERVIVEGVQNALDANARKIGLIIDLKKRTITVSDDGDGVDREMFEQALRSVGLGVKTKEKLGRFGLGLISPLDKCENFTFTSQLKSGGQRICWTFVGKDIEVQPDDVKIPVNYLKRMPEWSTVMRIHKFTDDRATSFLDIDSLAKMVQEKLGPAMRKQGVTCKILFVNKDGSRTEKEVKPNTYEGDPIEVVTYSEEDAGDVEFELYTAVKRQGNRTGSVVLSEFDTLYPITWPEFLKQARSFLSKDVIEALGSGFFEGVIRSKKVELHPSRRKFEYNDAVVGLCIAIEQWYKDVGRKLYTDERIEEQERRHQQLGLKTVDRLRELLRQPEFAKLLSAVQEIPFGTQGDGHAEAGTKTGETTGPTIRTGVGGAGTKRTPGGGGGNSGGGSGGPRTPPVKTRPGDVPTVVEGPDGKKRDVVRSDSSSLMFVHSALAGSDRLWEFDDAHGIIYFNVRHPIWVSCDKRDHHVLQLQEWIALQALHLLLQPKHLWESLRDFTDQQAGPYVDLMIISGHLRNRKMT